MDTIEMVKTALAQKGWVELRAISAETKVPVHTIRAIVRGITTNPRHKTLEPLRLYVESTVAKTEPVVK